jgi:hypothetical protein
MSMTGTRRLERQAGRHANVDGIPFKLPVDSQRISALMAGFAVSADKVAALLPGNELYPFRLWNKGCLVITVVNYRDTDIGDYIEFSIALACTHGRKAAPRLAPLLLRDHFELGQYVIDLPVSTEVSVKGGKGIWGMPKHQANLDFKTTGSSVSSQYDLGGQLCVRIEIARPSLAVLPVRVGAANYCAFRGMLMKSYIYFQGRAGLKLGADAARLAIGTHPRVRVLKDLEIEPAPLFAAHIPDARGMLDDYFESWFLSYPEAAPPPVEGLESVVGLGQGKTWLDAPSAPIDAPRRAARAARAS